MSDYVTRHSAVYGSEDLGGGLIFERVKEDVTLKVKACPYCGGPGKTVHEDSMEGDDMIRIVCQACGIGSGGYETHEETAEAWNKRVKLLPSDGKKGAKMCPFCGGKGEIMSGVEDDETEDMYCVECDECHAHTEYYEDAREALKRWNKRKV